MRKFLASGQNQYLTSAYLKWGFGLLSLMLLIFGAAFTWISWQAQKAEAARSLSSVAELGGRAVDVYFTQFESAFSIVGQQLVEDGSFVGQERAQFLLQWFLLEYPALKTIQIKNNEGQLLASSGAEPSTVNPDSYLPKLSEAASGKRPTIPILNIGSLYINPVDKQWMIPLRYSLQTRPGASSYVIHAALSLAKQQELWQGSALPEQTMIGMIRDDGYVLSRYPAPAVDAMGALYERPQTGRLIIHLRQNEFPQNGLLEGALTLNDGTPSMVAVHRFTNYPLTFFADTPVAYIRSLWWQNAQFTYLLITLLFAGFVAIYYWTNRRQLAWEKERGQSNQKFSLAVHAMENTMDGIMVIDAGMYIVSVNKGFTDVTGYTAEEAIGQTPKMFKSPYQDKSFYKELWHRLRQDGRWQGEIWDQRKTGGKYPLLLRLSAVRPENQVTHYVGTFNDISQYKDYESALEFLANHDPLTNLPNRILLNNRLEDALGKAKQEKSLLCVMFIDLDRFKIVNDSLGHEVGDRLLQKVAERLVENVRPTDTVARLGGDEFTVLLDQLRTIDEAALIAQKLLDALQEPAHIDEHQLYISASIGISFYPDDGLDANTLLKYADTAMYRAKEEGRDKFKFFSIDMNARAREFMIMANSLRQALQKNQLVIEYQPRVNLASGKMVGVEALIRWNHPELGRISPEKFIPLAEETGLIESIGAWVMQSACLQGKQWLDAGFPLQVAVNLSVRQFRKQGLVQSILKTVNDTGFRTDLLEVEITESLMMENPQVIKETLLVLREHGIKIAIDDFGTGYSSLSYLKQFPISYVKIDKSFVQDTPEDPDSVAIVKTIISMAKNLRLDLIAEGVETLEQRNFLLAEGCHDAQGFYFSRSVPAAEITAFLLQKEGNFMAA